LNGKIMGNIDYIHPGVGVIMRHSALESPVLEPLIDTTLNTANG